MGSARVKRYTGLVIGAGRMGAFYDTPQDGRTLTHCHAFVRSPRVHLAGIVDPDASRRGEAAARWGTAAYASIGEAVRAVNADIVSICTPTATHAQVVEEVATRRPPFLFLEKPVGSVPGEAVRIAARIREARAACMVNYPRSFDPAVQDTARAAGAGDYGAFITGTIYYAKGIRNNGSHVISLVHQVLGGIAAFQVLDGRVDYDAADPSLDVFLRLERGGTLHVVPVDERAYSIIDATFLFETARVHFRNFGLQVSVSRRRDDPVFAGYRDLEDRQEYVDTGLGRSMDRAVEQIVTFLDDGSAFDSELESALRTEQVVDGIIQRGAAAL